MMNRIPNSAPVTTELPDTGWAQEVRRLENQGQTVVPYTQGTVMPGTAMPQTGTAGMPQSMGGGMTMTGGMDLTSQPMMPNGLPSEVIENPVSREEVYKGSLKAMLNRYKGNYVVATFLVGTQSTTSWEGILYDVGNDYMTIYQEGRDRYIVSDIYSLKFIEFYDTRCRDICDEVLRSGWMPNQGM